MINPRGMAEVFHEKNTKMQLIGLKHKEMVANAKGIQTHKLFKVVNPNMFKRKNTLI